jgi:hypothetical protein
MLGRAREFRYDWVLLRARDLPHEASDPQLMLTRDQARKIAVNIAKLQSALACPLNAKSGHRELSTVAAQRHKKRLGGCPSCAATTATCLRLFSVMLVEII